MNYTVVQLSCTRPLLITSQGVRPSSELQALQGTAKHMCTALHTLSPTIPAPPREGKCTAVRHYHAMQSGCWQPMSYCS